MYDGPTNRSTLLGTFCGTEPPPNLVSTYGVVFVHYFAHWPLREDGFQVRFDTPRSSNTGKVYHAIRYYIINGYPKTGLR